MKTFIRSTNWRLGKIVAIVCAIVLAIGTRSRLDAADAESSVKIESSPEPEVRQITPNSLLLDNPTTSR